MIVKPHLHIAYCILHIQMVEALIANGLAFKNMIKSLSDLEEVCLLFYPDKLYLNCMDGSHVSFTTLEIAKTKFGYYKTNLEQNEKFIAIRLDVSTLSNRLTFVDENDPLSLVYDRKSPDIFLLAYESTRRKQFYSMTIKLLNLSDSDQTIFQIPAYVAQTEVVVKSKELEKIIRDFSNVSDVVMIETSKKQLASTQSNSMVTQITFSVVDDKDVKGSITLKEYSGLSQGQSAAKDSKDIKKIYNVKDSKARKEDVPVRIHYSSAVKVKLSLSYLVKFMKPAAAYDMVHFKIYNEYPCQVSYTSDLGQLSYYLAPKLEDPEIPEE